MARTLKEAEEAITVMCDTLFRCASTLGNQIPFAPHDPLAESVYDCMALALNVANEVRDGVDRSPMNWRTGANDRLEALR